MELKIRTVGDIEVQYYISGKQPSLLLLTGTHGDELEVIDCLKKTIKINLAQLPEFVFIPEMSPSAVLQKTRLNKDGLDINRHFFDDSDIEEVKAVMKIIGQHQFELGLGN